MQTEFWLERWREGRIGFHRDAPMPFLVDHWHSLALPAASRVLVPLAGKTLDMMWLAEQGHRVLGVELSQLAVQQFFDEHGLEARVHESGQGVHYKAGNVEIIQGDVLALDDDTLAGCDAVYDRAAIIALPADMRKQYARDVYGRLPSHCRGLMITLDYPQSMMDGPPFSVPAEDIDALLGHDWHIEELERGDLLEAEPHFRDKGLTSLDTAVYRLGCAA